MIIITGVSHLDHALTPEQVAYIDAKYKERNAFFIDTFTLPDNLGTVPCGLHGPIMGDAPVGVAESDYVVRGERKWESRVCDRETRQVREVTVIAGPHEGLSCMLYTAFGGPLAPHEPGDPDLKTSEQIRASLEFWAEHALSRGV